MISSLGATWKHSDSKFGHDIQHLSSVFVGERELSLGDIVRLTTQADTYRAVVYLRLNTYASDRKTSLIFFCTSAPHQLEHCGAETTVLGLSQTLGRCRELATSAPVLSKCGRGRQLLPWQHCINVGAPCPSSWERLSNAALCQ
eukprot:TRINITY_DN1621_c0_g1_i1.p2 TRINITY_DN1621_c0_g1~~TRINITY_DN1621_c0_g1_i1.p2  ORF type:complete len:161 (-),score=26.05 TRINITY_DN1621_c0_g1_i1:244-675(-)